MSNPRSKEIEGIVEILDDFLEEEEARELVARLEQEIGQKSNDEHLKSRLSSLKRFYEKRPLKKEHLKYAFLYAVVAFHMFVIAVNIVAFFLLPFLYPLWVWMPVNSFILTVTFTREVCPLTRLENYLRTSLGMSRIGGFIGHYFVRPFRRVVKTYRFGLRERESRNGKN
jgi:hypothetical protein|tara:strand:+ start:59589 stop:60098 length:510 start_codon:yes stop_codon:yes gene_type:complete